MPAIKYINRLRAIDQLIRLKATGNPRELAEKFELTERQIYKYLQNLEELGAEIEFDKLQNSYKYKTDGELVISFEQKTLKIISH